MEQPFFGDAIMAELCEHMRPAVAWLRDVHKLLPVRAVLDIKANTLSVEYDARTWDITPTALASALISNAKLEFHAGGFVCRHCWQSASSMAARVASNGMGAWT